MQKPGFEINGQKTKTTINSVQSPDSLETIPPLPAKGYFLKLLAKGLYYFSTGKTDTLFAATNEGTLLIDPLKDSGESLLKAIQEVNAPPVKMVIYSYGNLKRIGAASLFSGNIRIIAHRETAKFIQDFGNSNFPKPSISFGKNYSLGFGGLRVNLKYPERGKNGKVIIYFPSQKVLMYIDAVPKTAPPKNLNASKIFSRAKVLREILKFDFKNYVSGNYFRPGNKEEMKEILNYFYATKSANKKASDLTTFNNKGGEKTSSNQKKSIAKNCLQLLAPQWSKRLKGFEIAAQSHCRAWTDFHLDIPSSQNPK